ncbi:cytochrome P450 [Streptomyces sp. NPDC051567]|uniref:cytochrome P450 n=1 Tax=Streptomyces sp. NPDC051567 TaxID=3365660 RepID=UPI003790AFB8
MSFTIEEEAVRDRRLPPLHRLTYAEVGPPRPTTLPNGTPAWLITRYQEARQVLTDPRFSRAELLAPDAPVLGDAADVATSPASIFNQDGEGHRRLRRTVQSAFTPRAVAGWEPWVASAVEQVLDTMEAAGPPADLVASFTRPLPFAVTSRLMGLEGLDAERLGHWTGYVLAEDRPAEEVAAVLEEFAGFAAGLIAERRRAPGEDLVGRLVRAADEDGAIPEEQLVHLVCGLASSGNESTTGMLGNSLVYLLGERRDAWSRLADDGAAALATERLLHAIPLGDEESSTRRAVEDVEIGGVSIAAGSVVAVSFGSANRDRSVFPGEPTGDLFAPLEAASMAFGAGPHHCLGARLIRMEMRLALRGIAARFPELRLTEPVESIAWQLGSTTRSPERLGAAW